MSSFNKLGLKIALRLSLQRFQHRNHLSQEVGTELRKQEESKVIIENQSSGDQQPLEKNIALITSSAQVNKSNPRPQLKQTARKRSKRAIVSTLLANLPQKEATQKRLVDLQAFKKIKKLDRSELRHSWTKQRVFRRQANSKPEKPKKNRPNLNPLAQIKGQMKMDDLKVKRENLLQRKIQDWTTPNLICKISRQMAYLLS